MPEKSNIMHNMHNDHLAPFLHHHQFNRDKHAAEKRTLAVVWITLVMMIAEIAIGWWTNSMALFADGWHMGTHAFALGISLLAYVAARKYKADTRFAFGTWKIEILGAYSSAVVLGLVGLIMIYASVERLISPLAIHYDEALIVAVFGLAVNLVCAVILNHQGHSHDHSHGHFHDHDHAHAHDLNLKSAYIHVVADALTSVLAIAALIGAKYWAFNWLDPIMGLVGAALILVWAKNLLIDTGSILLDREDASPLSAEIRQLLEADGLTTVFDLHVWKVAQQQYACIIGLLSAHPQPIDRYKACLASLPQLVHITIEPHLCSHP